MKTNNILNIIKDIELTGARWINVEAEDGDTLGTCLEETCIRVTKDASSIPMLGVYIIASYFDRTEALCTLDYFDKLVDKFETYPYLGCILDNQGEGAPYILVLNVGLVITHNRYV